MRKLSCLLLLVFACTLSYGQKVLLLDKTNKGKRIRVIENQEIQVKIGGKKGEVFTGAVSFPEDGKSITLNQTVTLKLTDIYAIQKPKYNMWDILHRTKIPFLAGTLYAGISTVNGVINNDSPIIHRSVWPVLGSGLLIQAICGVLSDTWFVVSEVNQLRIIDLKPQ